MSMASLIWITPDAERMVAHIARVSNPANQDNPDYEKLVRYLVEHKHWSPLEMANACIEVNTTRDISRQILRHSALRPQEFSQRYAAVDALPPAELRECRIQDTANRQNSFDVGPGPLADRWEILQHEVYDAAVERYKEALSLGIAKEQARALLPEGLTPTRLYLNANLRGWIHYLQVRTGPETQKEHRAIAQQIAEVLRAEIPTILKAAGL